MTELGTSVYVHIFYNLSIYWSDTSLIVQCLYYAIFGVHRNGYFYTCIKVKHVIKEQFYKEVIGK